PQSFERQADPFTSQDAVDLIAGQAGQPGKDVVAAACGVVIGQLAQSAQHGFLHHLFAEMAIAADAIQTEGVERLQDDVRERLHSRRIAGQRSPTPGGVEHRVQDRTSFAARNPSPSRCSMLAKRRNPSWRNGSVGGAQSRLQPQTLNITASFLPRRGTTNQPRATAWGPRPEVYESALKGRNRPNAAS